MKRGNLILVFSILVLIAIGGFFMPGFTGNVVQDSSPIIISELSPYGTKIVAREPATINLSLKTSKVATCFYGVNQPVDSQFSTSKSLNHFQTVYLANGKYVLEIKCSENYKNAVY